MKKPAVFLIIIISLSILFSCNSKKEKPLFQTDIIVKSQIGETEQESPEQNWKESLLSGKEISTQEDIELIKSIVEKVVENNNLEELQTFLETEAKKEKVPPQILFGLSLVYGRKGLVKEEYKTIEKLEEQVKQRPGIAFNLSLVYGRKETLKSQIDKAEAEALALLQGFVYVTSTPEGAEVYLDGVLKGTTPYTTLGLGEGSYTVELRLKNYKDLSKTTSVKPGKTTEVTEELTLLPGSLVINSDPVGATVILAGKEMGVTPLELEKIIPGSYELIIKKIKYQENTTSIVIEPGIAKSATFVMIHMTGKIFFPAIDSETQIYLDDKRVYLQDNLLNDIIPGNHLLVLKKSGYIEKKLTLLIKPDKTEYINEELIRAIPFANINIDGKPGDWIGIEPLMTDVKGDSTDNKNRCDIKDVYLAVDEQYTYIRFDFFDTNPFNGRGNYFNFVIQKNSKISLVLQVVYRDGRWKSRMKLYSDIQITSNFIGKAKVGNQFFEARFSNAKIFELLENNSIYVSGAYAGAESVEWDNTKLHKTIHLF